SGSSITQRIMTLGNRLVAQSAAMGALPTLYAATEPSIRGGEYIGPGGWFEMKGYPTHIRSSARSHDRVSAERLWRVSEELTQVHYKALALA
ncbi:MAG: short-chain dehydrogenase, partial [Myxococcota bacterium]